MNILVVALLLVAQSAFGAFKIKGLSDVTVTSAGTRVQLTASNIRTPSVCIESKASNSGRIIVGGDDVGSGIGIELAAGQSACFTSEQAPGYDVIDLSTIYLDASTNSQVAKVIYYVYTP